MEWVCRIPTAAVSGFRGNVKSGVFYLLVLRVKVLVQGMLGQGLSKANRAVVNRLGWLLLGNLQAAQDFLCLS